MDQDGDISGLSDFFWDASGGSNSKQWAVSENSVGGSGGDGDKKVVKRERGSSSGSTSKAEESPLPTPKRVRCVSLKSCKGAGSGDAVVEDDHIWTERERRRKMRSMFTNLHALIPHLPAKADKSTIVDEAISYITSLQETLQSLEKQKLERLRGSAPLPAGLDEATLFSIIAQHFKSSLQAHGSISGGSSSGSSGVVSGSSSWAASSTNSPATTPRPQAAAPRSPPPPPQFQFQTWCSANAVVNVSGADAHISVCAAKRACVLTGVAQVLDKHGLEVVSAQVCADRLRCMLMIHARAERAYDQCSEAVAVEEIYKVAVGEINSWLSS